MVTMHFDACEPAGTSFQFPWAQAQAPPGSSFTAATTVMGMPSGRPNFVAMSAAFASTRLCHVSNGTASGPWSVGR